MRFLILTHDADRFRQERYLRRLNLEFKNLKQADIVESAQAATATLYKYWQHAKVVEVTPQSRLSNILSSASTQRAKLLDEKARHQNREWEALRKYHTQGERRNSNYWIKLICA